MSIVKEIYLTARGVSVEQSLLPAIKARTEAEKEIFEKVNEIGQLSVIDLISMMLPIVTASLKDPEYFGQLFGGAPGLSHAELLKKIDLAEFADAQRIIQTVFGLNPKQKYLVTLKEDLNSPAGYSVKRFLLLIDSDNLENKDGETLTRLLQTVGIPKGKSVSVLYDTTLEYNSGQVRYQQMLTSNLLITYILTSLAANDPRIFKEEFNYKISAQTGRSTYIPDPQEVLFEISQTAEAPASWFEIFDKVEADDFDLNTELTRFINSNLAQMATAV